MPLRDGCQIRETKELEPIVTSFSVTWTITNPHGGCLQPCPK
jgi:hypothetical protein